MRSPCAARSGRLSRDSQMGDMADAGQGFSSKSVGTNGRKVFKILQFRGGESLTQDRQVISLQTDINMVFFSPKPREQAQVNSHQYHDRCQ